METQQAVVPPVQQSAPVQPQQQISQQLPQQPKKSPNLFMIGLIVLVFVGMCVFIFAKDQIIPPKNQAQQQLPVTTQVAQVTDQPVQDITIVPVQAAQFRKKVVTENDECGRFINMVTYTDESKNTLTLNSLGLVSSQDAKKDLLAADVLLSGQKKVLVGDNLAAIEGAFSSSCAGFYPIVLKELPNITYPGTQATKAIMVVQGEDSFGTLAVKILAKAGETYLYLSSARLQVAQFDKIKSECFDPERDNTQALLTEAEKCFRERLTKDAELEKAASQQAQDLITKFSIQ